MQGAAYMRRVRRLASRLARVRAFFPGYLGPVEKNAYFKIADLFASPSVHESYGLNVVEAMQAGLPILASDHYGIRDILKEEFGRSVSYADLKLAPKLMAAALKDLLVDKPALRGMGERARRAGESMSFAKAAGSVLEAALVGVS